MKRPKHISAIIIIAMIAALGIAFLTYSQKSEAFIWGGQFSLVIPCYNGAEELHPTLIWVRVGGPLGGNFIWAPGITRTFDYGPPTHAGQYGLGLAAPVFFCLYSTYPLSWMAGPAFLMTMLGTSK